ncbi:MAG: DUF5698 domain-containing protein [Oscillospiraceae bacterium]|jgi:uncharacterized protein YebE (UPF0316 family)|nr:DUF5698 domain-containing protein [Oscillospiraceae bacterium]
MVYAFIFVAKLMEVSISTVRQVLTNRGNRTVASLLAAAEITIWLIVTSTVLLEIRADPLRAVVYGLAYAIGIYLGILIEDKLALGLSQIEVIAEFDEAKEITKKLRDFGYGATTYDCEGLEGKKLSISLKIRRKDVPTTIKLLREYSDLFVTVTDIRRLSIGNIGRRMLRDKMA